MALACNAVVDTSPIILRLTPVVRSHCSMDRLDEGAGIGPYAYYDPYGHCDGTAPPAGMRNLCVECGVDLGYSNPRQLCGKFMCDNPSLEVASCEEDDGGYEGHEEKGIGTEEGAIALVSGGRKLKVD